MILALVDDNQDQLRKKFNVEVPPQTHSVSIVFHHVDKVWGTYMVYDPKGALRGQYLTGKTPQPVVIHEHVHGTSPYTVAGPIQAGMWTIEFAGSLYKGIDDTSTPFLEISFHERINVRQQDEVNWLAKPLTGFRLDRDEDKVVNYETRWYKGDFHTHTIYSDGQMTREENMQSARNQMLDFFVATDHNVVPTSWVDDDTILVIPGVEVTSSLGHFNIINPDTSPFSENKLDDMDSEAGMKRLIEGQYGNALISINHPFLTVWKWLCQDTPLAKIDTLEIWNDPTYPDNPQATEWALKAWDILLTDGHQITGIGGSDSHMKPDGRYEGSQDPSLIGDPGTFVYCEGLSIRNLMNGLKRGNVTVSRGELLLFTANGMLPGETCNELTGEAEATVLTNEPLVFEWIVDGKLIMKEEGNKTKFTFDFKDGDYHYIRVNARKLDGTLYAFSNPIFFHEKSPKLQRWGEIIELMKEHMDD